MDNGGISKPVKPASLRAVTVRKTCSMQGLKQQMRVMRSFWEGMN